MFFLFCLFSLSERKQNMSLRSVDLSSLIGGLDGWVEGPLLHRKPLIVIIVTTTKERVY